MVVRKLGEPLDLICFTRCFEKHLYLLLVDSGNIKIASNEVQRIVGKEIERASVEWHDFLRIHDREPDEEFCIECLDRFKKEQLPLIVKKMFSLGESDFVDIFLKNVTNHSLVIRERFIEEDYQFILSSERYYAEKYYKEHAVLDVGYEELDIRTSQKAQVKGWHDLIQAFEQRFDSLYKAYERVS